MGIHVRAKARDRGTETIDPVKQHLYVGSLPRDYTEDQLRELFAADGREVESVTIRTQAKTGRSRGFGFIKMASEEHAASAVAALNGAEVDGHTLKVSEAFRETRERPVSTAYEDFGRPSRPRRRG
jgi:RNA recognition motif-containing protein